jgi:HlyD family secretion protein
MSEFFKQRYSLPIIVVTMLVIVIAWRALLPTTVHLDGQTPAKKVEFINTQISPHRARVLGYGVVEPTTMLKANAEVAGKIVYMHPKLKQGATLPQGTRVLEIDKTNYNIALAKAEADLAANLANLEQLNVERKNNETSLRISTKRLTLGENELSRKKRLLKQKSVSQSTVDTEEQNLLNLRQEVQNLKSQLSLIPTRKQVLQAQITAAKAQVSEQQRNIERTDIVLPFNARIGQVHIQEQEFVSTNAALFNASDIAQVEIKAQMPLLHARALILGVAPNTMQSVGLEASSLLNRLHLDAKVRWVENLETAKWPARVVRLGEALDSTSRTLPIIVAVDNSYNNVKPGERPPLLQGMYTEVELRAPAVNRLVIPRRAIHNGQVYIANSNDELEMRTVQIEFNQGDLSVVKQGLKPGERLIINDLVPAFQGMKLNPVHNATKEKQWLALTAGEGEFK